MTRHAPFRGAKEAPPLWGGVADLCRKSMNRDANAKRKFLRGNEKKIYGIFGNSKIVQSELVRNREKNSRTQELENIGSGWGLN